MARTTKQLSGGGKDKFLRALVAGEATIPADAAKRLGDKLADTVAEVRVRRDAWEDISKSLPKDAKRPPGQRGAAVASTPANTPPGDAAVAPAAFDPFAFSAVAVLTKKGKAALDAELAKIASPADLHKLANAQHLAVDAALANPAALRAAIVAAAERRIADRKAAAS